MITCHQLIQLYVKDGRSQGQCAKELGVSKTCVRNYMRKFNICSRDQGAAVAKANTKDLRNKRFTRLKVLKSARNPSGRHAWCCRCDCGKQTTVVTAALLNGSTKSCGCLAAEKASLRNGRNSPCYKGGRIIDGNGYVKILVPRVAHGKYVHSNYVLEHSAVMAKHLGRALTRYERVHHKNGKRADNRLENLELWTTAHPSGQRVEDVTAFAVEHLKRYAPAQLKT